MTPPSKEPPPDGGLTAEADDQRRHKRCVIKEPARLLFRGEHYACTIIDLSGDGALVKSRIVPRVGEAVVLEVDPLGGLGGTIVRRTEAGLALRFDIDQAGSEAIIERLTLLINRPSA